MKREGTWVSTFRKAVQTGFRTPAGSGGSSSSQNGSVSGTPTSNNSQRTSSVDLFNGIDSLIDEELLTPLANPTSPRSSTSTPSILGNKTASILSSSPPKQLSGLFANASFSTSLLKRGSSEPAPPAEPVALSQTTDLFSLEDDDEQSQGLLPPDDSVRQDSSSVMVGHLIELEEPPTTPTSTTMDIKIGQEALSLTQPDVEIRIARLKKYETKYPELANAYKELAQKFIQVESVIKLSTPITNGVNNLADIEAFAAFMKELQDARSKADLMGQEIPRLKRQVSELKEIQQLEAATKADMFSAMQAKLAEKDQEIAKLKEQLQAQESAPAVAAEPTEQPETPLPPLPALVDLSRSMSQQSATDDSQDVLRLKIRDLKLDVKSITRERDELLAKYKELSTQMASTTSQSPMDVLVDIGIHDSPTARSAEGNSSAGVPMTEYARGLSQAVSKLQAELNQTTQQLQEETRKSVGMRNEIESLQRAWHEKEQVLQRQGASGGTGAMSTFSMISRGIRSSLRSVSDGGSSPGGGLLSALIPPSAVGLGSNESTPTSSAVLPIENGEELSYDEASELEQLESIASLRADLEAVNKTKGELEAKIRDLEGRLVSKQNEIVQIKEKMDVLKTDSSKAIEEAKLSQQTVITNLQKEISQLTAQLEKANADNLEQIAIVKKEAEIADMSLKRQISVFKQQIEVLESANSERLQNPAQLATPSDSKALEDQSTLLEEKGSLIQSLQAKVAEMEAQIKELQNRLDTAVIAARKAGEAAAQKVVDIQSLLRESIGRVKEAEERASKADAVIADTMERLALAETGRKEALEKNAVLDSKLTAMDKDIKAAEEAKAEAISKMDKAYGIIRKSKQELDSRTKEHEALKRAYDELMANMVESDKRWQEKLSIVEDDLAGKASEAQALSSTLELLRIQMRTVSMERDRSRHELLELRSQTDPLGTDLLRPSTADTKESSQPPKSALERALKGNTNADISNSTEELLFEHDDSAAPDAVPNTQGVIDKAIADISKQTLSTSESNLTAPIATEAQTPPRVEIDVSKLGLEEAIARTTEQLDQSIQECARAKAEAAEASNKISLLSRQFAEEEEKKNKSIQLLRNTKARILKLEDVVKGKEAELKSLKTQMDEAKSANATLIREKELKIASLTFQVDDLTAKLKRLQEELAETSQSLVDKLSEVDESNKKISDLSLQLSHIRIERDALKEIEGKRRVEYESSKMALDAQTSQLAVWPARLQELEQRIGHLDEELETSKKLFQSKSIEAEALKLKISELERSIYETELAAGSQAGDLDAHRREIDKLRAEITNLSSNLRAKESEAALWKAKLSESVEKYEAVHLEFTKSNTRVEELKATIDQMRKTNESLENKFHVEEAALKQRLGLVEKERNLLNQRLEEKDQHFEEVKARESQLSKLNKALKDEVRKLSKLAGTSPVSTPPITTQNSGLDEKDLRAASSSRRDSTPLPLSSKREVTSLSSLANTRLASDPSVNYLTQSDSPARSLRGESSSSGMRALSSSANFESAHTSFDIERPQASSSSRISVESSDVMLNVGASGSNEQNIEYLKNVFIKFVESSKSKKTQMIPVLSMILKLSPEELKRIQKNL